MPSTLTICCGRCFFQGREFFADPSCPDHADEEQADAARAEAAGWTKTPAGEWWREIRDGETHDADRLERFNGSGPYVWADSAEDALAYDALCEIGAAMVGRGR
jgi:hypothetical protein